MRIWQLTVVVAAVAISLVSCASLEDKKWYQQAKATSAKAASVAADSTSKALKRTQHYLAEKDVLKTFQDAGEHGEGAVLDVLHKAGIGRGKGQSAPGAPKTGNGPVLAGAGKPVAAPTDASHPRTSAPATTSVPIQYAGALQWPVEAGLVSSEYGPRWGKIHKGMDIAADAGEPVYAIAAGEVIYAGDGLRGYGNVVIVRHDKQMSSLYAHNSELKVHQGDQVAQGTLLALLGNTGHSTGPHVHFEIREGDTAIDPRGVLPKSTLAEARDPAGKAATNLAVSH
jgi:murein DD-endopeptidase MepM/ murein hydrolase activator NlpD